MKKVWSIKIKIWYYFIEFNVFDKHLKQFEFPKMSVGTGFFLQQRKHIEYVYHGKDGVLVNVST